MLLFTDRRKAILVTVAGVAAVAAVACGSDDSPATFATQTPFPTSAAIPTARPAPTATTVPAPAPKATTAPAANAPSGSNAAVSFDWFVSEVGQGTKPAIALTSDGTPWVGFMFETQQGFVKAAKLVDGQWDVSTVGEGYYYGPLDVAVGPDDVARVAWHDHQALQFQPNLGDIELAVQTSSGWSTKTLRDRGHDGWDTRLIVDSKGITHLAGIDPKEFGGDGVEYYRVDTDGNLTVEPVGSGPQTYKFAVSVAVDSAGTPYVTYYDQGPNDLTLATKSGGKWTRTVVDGDGDAGQFAELIIDGNDGMHISYVTQTGRDAGTVKYASKAAGASDWTIEDIDKLDSIFYGFEGAREITSLKLDSAGNPWVAYTDEKTLKLAVRGDSGWQINSVSTPQDRGKTFGQLVSLELDGSDNPHLVTFEVTATGPLNGNVLYFKGTPK